MGSRVCEQPFRPVHGGMQSPLGLFTFNYYLNALNMRYIAFKLCELLLLQCIQFVQQIKHG
jgi:hypothetical protein